MTTTPLATVPTGAVETLTIDQWLVERDKVVGQVKRLVHLWFVNQLGSQRELAKHLQVSPGTVSYHIKALRSTGELTEEHYAQQPAQKRTNFVRPVENSTPTPNPPTPVYEAEIVIDDPIVLSHAEPVSFSESRAQPYRNPAAAQRELTDQVGSEDYVRVIRLFDDINDILQQHAFRGTLSTSEWTSILGCCQSTAAVASAMHNNVQQYAGMEQRADWS